MALSTLLAFLLLAPPLGEPAPRFTLKVENPTASGMTSVSTRKLAEAGRPLVVDFAAAWCVPCRKSLPELARRVAPWRAKGVQVVVVLMDETPEAQAEMVALLKSLGFTGAVVVDRFKLLARRYGVEVLPHTVVIDGKGILRWRDVGAGAMERLDSAVAGLASP